MPISPATARRHEPCRVGWACRPDRRSMQRASCDPESREQEKGVAHRTRGEQRTNRAISVVGPKKRFRSSVSFPLGTKAAGSLASTVAIPRENPSHLSWTDGVADRWRAKMAQQSPVRRRKRPHEEDSASRDLSLARRRQAAPYFRGCSTASQANRPSFSLCAFKGLGFPAPCAAYAALPAFSL